MPMFLGGARDVKTLAKVVACGLLEGVQGSWFENVSKQGVPNVHFWYQNYLLTASKLLSEDWLLKLEWFNDSYELSGNLAKKLGWKDNSSSFQFFLPPHHAGCCKYSLLQLPRKAFVFPEAAPANDWEWGHATDLRIGCADLSLKISQNNLASMLHCSLAVISTMPIERDPFWPHLDFDRHVPSASQICKGPGRKLLLV